MMLSRVADSMFWMARYIERAENIARFVDVNLQLSLDLGETHAEQWGPLVAVTGDAAEFRKRHGEPTRESVMRFLTFDREYSNSIVSCLAAARENARIIRENISTGMWEELNKFHLMMRDEGVEQRAESDPLGFYTDIRRASLLFTGLTDNTMSHGEGWHFARLGRLLERADKTTRILDVRYFLLLPQVSDVGTPLDIVQWSALLRSATALDMYRARHGRLVPTRVAEFLLLNPQFPRAVLFCLEQAEGSLREITGSPQGRFHNLAEKRLGRLRSELDYLGIEDVFDEGLHEFIDRVQRRLNEVCEAIHDELLDPSVKASNGGNRQSQMQA